ncbi:DUF2961 domain-containing protein [bacterium]|nr:DUF2961 domain-containing protein [bacterium]
MRSVVFFLAVATLWATAHAGGSIMPSDISSLWQPQKFTAARVSSTDPTGGNRDAISIRPWDRAVLADIAGPGMIHHIWFTIAHPDPMHLRQLVLRIYWDGETAPSVEAPVGDFFGLGHGMVYDINSVPIQIGSHKGLNCFWPMPFKQRATITVENQSATACRSFYYYIDYRKDVKIPRDARYFHAWYNQKFPADPVADYVLMEAEGEGHYVGCNMSIHLNSEGWWGEGDDHIYVDGVEKPNLTGTGSEDYFCGAWCYAKPFSNLYFGCPLMQSPDPQRDVRVRRPGSYWNVYRYHILDPIPFTKSNKVHIETGRAPGTNARRPFTNHHSSVGYWYQREPHQPFPPLPRAAERVSTMLE